MSETKASVVQPGAGQAPSRFNLSDLKIDDRKRRRRGLGWLGWFAAILGLGLLGFGGWLQLRGRPPVVAVAAARPKPVGAVSLLNASGYVTPRRRATVAAKITGRLEQVLVEEGIRVEPGQVLATLDDTDSQVRLASAEAERDATQASLADLEVNLANAERELARTQQLHEEGISTAQALDAARTAADSLRARIASIREQVRAAEARIQVAQQDVENAIIRAPFAGMVVSKDAQRGEIVSPISAGGGFTRTGIATIVDMSSVEIEVDVNESYIARVRPGQPVTGILDAYPDWQIPSKVRTIIPTADRQKATVKVRIAFDKLDPRILPDMGVKVSFLGEQKSEPPSVGGVIVPQQAVRVEAGQPVVFLYRDGKVERRAVRLGQASGATSSDAQEILAGVSEGEQVVVGDLSGLRDGQSVRLEQ
ncbi:MAG: efflux RND transporter periplasmic adaptor subunit [Acidobacteria bacterium]|nr:efflux RND transporter periplasmic adaptor subunit [Acidobacteriota bacterium]